MQHTQIGCVSAAMQGVTVFHVALKEFKESFSRRAKHFIHELVLMTGRSMRGENVMMFDINVSASF